MVGDERVVTKAGQETYGIERFFSSIFGKPVRGLAFFTLSLVSVNERKSYPLLVEQVVRSTAEQTDTRQKPAAKLSKSAKSARKVGRPKGSKTKAKHTIEWTSELGRLERMGKALLERINPLCRIRHLALDGHFGNNNVTQMVRQSLGLHIISKLRNDSALSLRYDGPQQGVGAPKRYGAKLDYDQIPIKYWVQCSTEKKIQTEIYQATMLHKAFADPLNVVVIVKTNLVTHKKAHGVLFSSALSLAYAKLLDAYRLRFQIEFNFRDAKQCWGFEDFMNVNKTPVTNAVGLSFLMVNLAQILLARYRTTIPDFSVLDLKALFCARRYAQAALNFLPDFADPFLIAQVLAAMPPLGAIHTEPTFNPNP